VVAPIALPHIAMDPIHPLTLGNKPITFPNLLPKLQELHDRLEDSLEIFNDSDTELLKEPSLAEKRSLIPSNSHTKFVGKKVDTFVPAGPEILKLVKLLPPPKTPNAGASLTIRREMKSMIKEESRDGPTICGFHFDPERSDGNIFNWVIELIGFDENLPFMK
jgi:ubiquitin-conjugating enzyme E2 Q